MSHRPAHMPAFEFVVVAGLRAAQLMRGCIARVESSHKRIVTAQLEVASGKVSRLDPVINPGNGANGGGHEPEEPVVYEPAFPSAALQSTK